MAEAHIARHEVIAWWAVVEPAGLPMPMVLRFSAEIARMSESAITVLELPAQERVYRPDPPPLWRVPQALAGMRRLLAEMPQGAALALAAFLPEAGQGVSARLQRRAALARTLVAGLELSREGAAVLAQDAPFGKLRVAPTARG